MTYGKSKLPECFQEVITNDVFLTNEVETHLPSGNAESVDWQQVATSSNACLGHDLSTFNATLPVPSSAHVAAADHLGMPVATNKCSKSPLGKRKTSASGNSPRKFAFANPKSKEKQD